MAMFTEKLTGDQEHCLRDQVITADQPGPVLRDFRVLLEFLTPKGVEAGGKYNLLPLKCIGELDRRLSRPLHLEMKRPQLRSHPYLQGLHLLLRASGLSRVEGAGSRARLVLDPFMLGQWDGLNPTEQYFHLLEAWLRLGRPEIGERCLSWSSLLSSCLQAWTSVPVNGPRIDLRESRGVYVIGTGLNFYLLALMDLFGLMEVEQPPRPITPWNPAGIKHVPFGDAVFTRLTAVQHEFFLEEDVPSDEDEDEDEDEDPEGWAPEAPQFGFWQPLFQPYFPEWRESLTLPEPASRVGQFVFRVSLGKIWRLIAMPADATLGDLVGWVLRSFQFSHDHLYEVSYRDRLGAQATAQHTAMDEGPWADNILIGTMPLEPGQTMQLMYDFGDCWKFTLGLERIEPPTAWDGQPRILESQGQSPRQY
jgi:hypothetical protein